MSKKKITTPQEEEYLDQIFDNPSFEDEEEMLNTFGQVADASVHHMEIAYKLTDIIMRNHADKKLSTEEILEIFRKASETILDCTPLKALFEKV